MVQLASEAVAPPDRQAHRARPRRRDQPRQRPVHQVAGRMAADPGEPRGDRAAQPRGLSRRHRHEPVGDRPRPLRHGNAERDPRQDAQGAGAGGRAVRRRVLLPALRGFAVRMPQAEDRHAAGDRHPVRRRHDGRPLHRRLAARPHGGRCRRRAADPRADRQGREDAARRRLSAGTRSSIPISHSPRRRSSRANDVPRRARHSR